MDKLAVVVIPVFKKKIDRLEVISLTQCFRKLGGNPISLVCPISLDSYDYIELAKINGISLDVCHFPDEFFISISSYNKFMLSACFYESFQEYKYILIHQTDAYVFDDELHLWCEKNYSYVGAPWFVGWDKPTTNQFLGVGNGGFSLRKVEDFLIVLNSKKNWKNINDLFNEHRFKNSNLIEKFLLTKSFIRKYYQSYYSFKNAFSNFKINEDALFGIYAQVKFKSFKVCTPDIAVSFSFEVNPEFLYKLNGNKLPFGCHGFDKYERIFWKNHINEL